MVNSSKYTVYTVKSEWVWDSSYHGTSIPNLDIKFS